MPQSTMSTESPAGDAKQLLEITNTQEQLVTKSFAQQAEGTLFLFLYNAHKHLRVPRRWSMFAFAFEYFQILALILLADYQWHESIAPLRDILTVVAVTHKKHSFAEFMFYLWGVLGTSLTACVLVGVMIRTYAKSESAVVPTMFHKLLQLLSNTMTGIFFLPFALVIMLLFKCEDSENGDEIMEVFNDKVLRCWSLEHITYIIVAGPMIILFGAFSLFFKAMLFESDPISDTITTRVHARGDMIIMILRCGVLVCSVFYSTMEYIPFASLLILTIFCSLYNIIIQPYYRERVNHARSGAYVSLLWATVCLGVNLLVHHEIKYIPAILIYGGTIPAFWLGKSISATRAKLIVDGATREVEYLSPRSEQQQAAPESVNAWNQGQPQIDERMTFKKLLSVKNWKYILIAVKYPADAAIIARALCVREKIAGRVVSVPKDNIDRADEIFAEQIEKSPESILTLLSYMNFLIYYAQQADKFRIHGDKINLLEPAIDIRFMIYKSSKELDHQRQSETTGSSTMDLASYIEFQNSYKEARKYHSEALKSIREFWTMLLADEEKFDLEQLPQAAQKINVATSAAHYHYEGLLRRHPDSIRLFRAYAEFLLGVAHDSKRANAFLRRADELEEAQSRRRTEERRQNGASSNFSTNIDLDDKHRAIISIDGKGIIQTLNHACGKMLQYSKSEVVGSNIKMLMPSPYAENHDTYIENYHRTGIKKVLGSVRSLDAKAKTGDLIPIRLSVNQTDVNGQVFFVGILEKQDDSTCILSVNANGAIMNCNQIFSKKFGRENREISGRNFGDIFGTTASDGNAPITNFEETYGSLESVKLHGKHGDGRYIQVIMSPKKNARDGTVHYRCTFEFLDEIEVMLSIDGAGIIRSSNHFIKHIFGHLREEVIGEKINMLMPEPYTTFHDTYLQTFAHTGIKTVLDSSRIVEGQHKDGSRFKIHLLVSEVEVNGSKMYSARSSFSKKTEIFSCRLTITSSGIINNHSETAIKMFDSIPQLVGVSLSRLIGFTSHKLEKMDLTEALACESGRGPVSIYFLNPDPKGGTERRDFSMEVIQQDLNGELFYIARIFDISGADVSTVLNKHTGEIESGNDLLPHFIGHSMEKMRGRIFGEQIRISHSGPVKLASISSFGSMSASPSSDAIDAVNLMDHLGKRVNATLRHRDESLLPFYLEASCKGDKIFCRIARRSVQNSNPGFSSHPLTKANQIFEEGDLDKESDLDDEDDMLLQKESKIAQNKPEKSRFEGPTSPRIMSPGVPFEDDSSQNDQEAPTPVKKKKVRMDDDGVSEHSSDAGSHSSNHHSETSTGSMKRIQKLRRRYEQSNQQNKSVAILRKKVIVGLSALVCLSMGLYTGINILATIQGTYSESISLCGSALNFHRNIYIYMNAIVSTPLCEPNCFWDIDELYKALEYETNAYENAFMSLYMTHNVADIYKSSKNYVYYNDYISPYDKFIKTPVSFSSATLKKLYIEEEIPLTELTDSGSISTTTPFIRAIRTYVFYARYLSNKNNWNEDLAPRYSYFILQNGPKSLGHNWNYILSEYHRLSDQQTGLLKMIQSLVVAISLFLIFCLGYFILRPSFNKVHEERYDALRLFLLIPKSVVRTLSRIQITLESSGSGSEVSDADELKEDVEDRMEEGVKQHKSKAKPSSSKQDNDHTPSRGHISSIMRNRKLKEEKKKAAAKGYIDAIQEDGAVVPSKGISFYWMWITVIFAAIKEKLHVRPMTKKWLSILFLLSVCFSVVTIYGSLTSSSSIANVSSVYYASELSSLAQDISYYSLQLVTKRGSAEDERIALSSALTAFDLRLNCITQGCEELSLTRTDNEDNHAELYYSNQCFFKDPSQCYDKTDNLYELSVTGLVNIASQFSKSANIVYLTHENLLNSTDFEIIYRSQTSLLRAGFTLAIATYSSELQSSTNDLKKIQGIIAGITSGFIIMSFFLFFRPMFNALQEENKQTKAMLLMIPDEVVANTKEIEEFIRSTDT